MIWDVGAIVAGAVTGDGDMVEEGATDLLLDTAAAFIPGVPAGASKAVRAAQKAARQAEKEAARRSKKIAECLAIRESYHAFGDQPGRCTQCTCCADFVKILAARSMEVSLRRKFLKKGCDYYLPGSVAKTPKAAIKRHTDQLIDKMGSFSNCFARAVKHGCTNLPIL